MRVFNRIVVVIGILLGIAGALFLVLYPIEAVKIAQANISFFEEALFNEQFRLYFIIGAAIWIVILLVLLILELRRPRRKAVRIRTDSGANAVLGVNSVVQSLEARIDELAGVRKVIARVRSRGKDVDVAVDLDTSPSVNIPVLTDQVVNLCRDIVEGQLGVKIHGKVLINVHHEPYPRGTMPPTQPLPRGAEAIATKPRLVEAPSETKPVEPKAKRPEPQPAVVREPKAEPVPAQAPAPVVEATPESQGPAPIGDLTPLETSANEASAEARDALDDLDLYDPTDRDE